MVLGEWRSSREHLDKHRVEAVGESCVTPARTQRIQRLVVKVDPRKQLPAVLSSRSGLHHTRPIRNECSKLVFMIVAYSTSFKRLSCAAASQKRCSSVSELLAGVHYVRWRCSSGACLCIESQRDKLSIPTTVYLSAFKLECVDGFPCLVIHKHQGSRWMNTCRRGENGALLEIPW